METETSGKLSMRIDLSTVLEFTRYLAISDFYSIGEARRDREQESS